MIVPFSELPGRHERHLRRKFRNPLFPAPVWSLAEHELSDIQRKDHDELLVFLADLRDLVRRAVDLRSNEETQVVLDLTGALEYRHFAQRRLDKRPRIIMTVLR